MTRAESLKSAKAALDAAIKALENQSGSGAVSISVNGDTQNFETRQQCLDFVNAMEKRVALLRRKRPLFRSVELT